MSEQFKLDDQTIDSIGWWICSSCDSEFQTVRIGEAGITAIDCREQYCGEYSIYWLQVWKGDQLVARYNARNIDSVEYADEEDCDYG